MTENPSLQPYKGVFVFNTGHWRLPSPITWLAGEGKAQRQNSLQAGWPVTSQRWSQSDFSPWSRSLLLGPKWIHRPQNWLLATSVAKGVLHWGQRGVLHWGQRAVPHWGQRGVLHWGQWGSALRTKRGSALRTKSSSALRTKGVLHWGQWGSALRTKRDSALRTMGFCTEDKEGFCTEDKEGFCTEDREGFHTEDKAPPPTVTSPQTSIKLLKWFAVSPESSVVPLYRLCKPHLCCPTLQTVQTASPLLSHFTDCANSLTSVVPLYRQCKPHLCCSTLQTVQTSPLLSHFTDCGNSLPSVVPLYRLCKQPPLCCPTLQTVQTASPLLSHFTDCANLTSVVLCIVYVSPVHNWKNTLQTPRRGLAVHWVWSCCHLWEWRLLI